MITAHFWPSGQSDPLARPAGYESVRQSLARKGGNAHFQLASNAMAPSSSRLAIGTASAANGYHHHCQHNGHPLPTSSADAEDAPRHTARSTRRGRSPTRRHLWAYSPERAHAEVQEERRLSVNSRLGPLAREHLYPVEPVAQVVDEAPPHPVSIAMLTSASPSTSSMPTASYEAPPVTNTSLPILSRPPAALSSHTSLEMGACQAEDAFEGELSYLRAAPTTAEDAQPTGAGPAAFEQVLYTRSHLPDLDLQSRYLWHALHNFRVQDSDYAKGYAERAKKAPRFDSAAGVCPFLASSSTSSSATPTSEPDSSATIISKTFNWSSLRLPLSLEHEWYGVTFRSVRRLASASLSLYQADRLSHEEAVTSGGLILYWYGQPDAQTGENLATCIWTSREEARKASALPLHKSARDLAVQAYETFELDRYRVVKREGESGLSIEPWA